MNRTTGRLLAAAVAALCAQAAQAASGDLDTTFDLNGFAFSGYTDRGLDHSEASALARDADGKLVVVGHARTNGGVFTNTAIVMSRFSPDGTLDTAFGGPGQAGRVSVSVNGFNVAADTAVGADGKIVIAGFAAADTGGATPRSLVLLQFNANGTPDTAFGSNGRVTVAIGAGGQIKDMAIQPDGKIVLAGQVFHSTGGGNFYLARFRTNGTPDTSFGATQLPNLTGSVNLDFGGRDDASAVAIQADGKIVVAGTTEASGGNAWAVARYSAGGLLDPTFGTSGRVTTNFADGDTGAGGDRAHAIALQGDGKIVVAGQAELDQGLDSKDFALARYNPNGSLDTTFGGDGKVTTDFVAGQRASDVANAVLVQPDGKIVAGGLTGATGGATLFGLARYNTNGSLDTTFGGDGKVSTDSRGRIVRAMTVQPVGLNGRLVVAGQGVPSGSTTRLTLARFELFTRTLTPIQPR